MQQQTIRLLIIDDVPDNRYLLRLDLEDEIPGIIIEEAGSGQEALQKIAQTPFTIVLCDILMPGIDGFTVLRKAREINTVSGTPFLFLSALRQPEVIRKGLELGAVDFLTKPYDLQELVYKVQNLAKIKHLQEELQQSQEELININKHLQNLNDDKNRVLRIVSHDLRSPLSGIKGLAKILRNESDASNENTVREFADMMYETADSLLRLVNDLLDIARIESNSQLTLERSTVSVAETVLVAINAFKLLSAHKNIAIETDIPSSLLISADVPKLQQVINNVLSNAVKFTESGGKITIRAKKIGTNSVVITIDDTGIGIPDNLMPHIFERFSKQKRFGTSGESGVGLGLPLVKSFVELHGGTVLIESSPGKGTSVAISLPISLPTF